MFTFTSRQILCRTLVVILLMLSIAACSSDETRKPAPPPNANASAAAPAAAVDSSDWHARFDAVYRLDDGQVLRRVPPPFIPERSPYFVELKGKPANQVLIPDTATFWWKDGKLEKGSRTYGQRVDSLRLVLGITIGLRAADYECPVDLLDLSVPGDWIVRRQEPSTTMIHVDVDRREVDDPVIRERLDALHDILRSELNRDVQFTLKTQDRPVVVVKGDYDYTPLENYPVKQIQIYAQKLDPYPSDPSDAHVELGLGRAGHSFQSFLDTLSNRLQCRFTNESNVADNFLLLWQNPHSDVGPETLDQVLENLHAQMDLTFTRETRKERVWVISSQDRRLP